MKRSIKRAGWLLVFAPIALFAGPEERIQTLVSNGRDSTILLQASPILPGSISVSVCDTLLSSSAYRFVTDPDRILLTVVPDSGCVIRIHCRIFPSIFDPVYLLNIPRDTVSSAPMSPKPAKRPWIEKPDNLDKSGSIFRGLSVGSDGMKIESGLRLQVSGNLTPSVEVSASLTDQNTPIQPEGNTQTLQEIDKVFVQIRMPGFHTTMGDYVYRLDRYQLGGYERKLEGAMGVLETRIGKVSASAAVSRGQFTTNHFLGQEGNQGPYQLTGSLGKREIIVLAGTEKVWIDGELMKRGEDNDYTIEYGNGQILFTRNRLITSDSRIIVDFEYSDQQYQKGIYTASADLSFFGDRLKIRTAFIQEGDDSENPLNFVFTETDLEALRNSGDDPDSAVVSGVVYVGENEGSYVRADSNGIEIYRYVGKDKGDTKVSFSYVGPNQGSYSFQGYGFYEYVGKSRGDYVPDVYLPLASRHQMALAAASLDMCGVLFDVEMGMSNLDLNLFSSLDDRDNMDIASTARIRVKDRPIRLFGSGLGTWRLDGNYRHIGDRYRALGRMTEVEHGRKWGFEEGNVWGENSEEIQACYTPTAGWEILGEWGGIEKEGFGNASRSLFETRITKKSWPGFLYRAENIIAETDTGDVAWFRQTGSLRGKFRGWQPSFDYLGEDRRMRSGDFGFKYDEWSGGLAYERGVFRGEAVTRIRDDRKFEDGDSEKSLAATQQLKIDLNGTRLTANLLYTYRDRDYSDPSVQDQKANLAEARIRFVPKRSVLDGMLHYRFSSTRISQLVRDTLQVGPGRGNYRYDEELKEYVPDTDGDFIFRTLQNGNFLPVNDIQLGGEFRFAGSGLTFRTGPGSFLKSIGARTLIRMERRDKRRDFWSVNRSLFSPDWGEDTTTVMAVFSLLQDVTYTSSSARLSVRLRYKQDDSEDYQLLGQGMVRRAGETGLQIKYNPWAMTGMLLEAQTRSESKTFESSNSDRAIQAIGCTAEISTRPRQAMELALKARFERAQDAVPDPVTRASALYIVPRFGYAFFGRGQLRTELEYGIISTKPDGRAIPYEMMRGDQPGKTIRWSVLLSYRVSGNVMATLNYRGRKEPWRDRVFQVGQVEVRAFF